MNILCTLYISSKKLGTIISLPRNIESIASLKQDLSTKVTTGSNDTTSTIRFNSPNNILILTDQGLGPRVDLQFSESKVVDEALRRLSSNEYIVLTDKAVMHGGKMYQTFGNIPSQCHWRAIPFVKLDDIIDYKSTGEIDDMFLREGYARELKEAVHILVPPDWDALSPLCTPYDLLIKKIDNSSSENKKDTVFIPFSGRIGIIPESGQINGRYIYLDTMPRFEGTCIYPAFTYNMETLIYKYGVLQDRLEVHGSMKVDSVCASMRSIAQRLKDVKNQFMACSVYDDVVAILEKARKME